MAWTFYSSSDASAPVLSGTNGALITVLDAILVNGYGAKAAAGWTKAFSGTNKAAYLQGAASGTDDYLRVLDDGSGTGGAREAIVRGYEAMTDVDTGTDLFPTAAQTAVGLYIRKSATADATTRQWVCVADEKTFIFYAYTGDSAGVALGAYFGEFYSYKSADAYRSILIARDTANSGSYQYERVAQFNAPNTGTFSGHYISRDHTTLVKSIAPYKIPHRNVASGFAIGGIISFPNSSDGGLYASRILLYTTSGGNAIRGYLRGFWLPLHPAETFADGSTFTGQGAYAGKTFIAVKTLTATNASGAGQIFLETSDTVPASS